MNYIQRKAGQWLAGFLEKPTQKYKSFAVAPIELLSQILRPGDILLVEGDLRISSAIKYLTQSTWSHAAIFVGDQLTSMTDQGEKHSLIEADLRQGVIPIPLSKYASFNTRICRPVQITEDDRACLLKFVMERIGHQYDLKNVFDLMRYLLPTPPVPTRWRRRMLALGSSDPTRAICSTLIAQAFQSIRYPILPKIRKEQVYSKFHGTYTEKEILHIRHYSLFTPKDFDISPYFQIIKPTIEIGFDYKSVTWSEDD